MARRFYFAPFTAAALLVASFAAPGMAAAESYWHPTNNEAGAKAYPEHFKSSKTRAQVQAEAAAAAREGASRFNSSNYPAPVKSEGPGKTRQQVMDELTQETPAQRNARQQALAG
ncbi:DUF4148 domain-containing protein [Comamonas sp. GB3 AK4-5]|uniref:DUF4148 domain-containing protein n=1 Tax=Comamonas sp. GB3 AK4-5 TaxID=3231487 RepID=UPI00351DD6C5